MASQFPVTETGHSPSWAERHVFSSTSARCKARTRLPRRRRQPAMFMRHPASVATTEAAALVTALERQIFQALDPAQQAFGLRLQAEAPQVAGHVVGDLALEPGA